MGSVSIINNAIISFENKVKKTSLNIFFLNRCISANVVEGVVGHMNLFMTKYEIKETPIFTGD